MTDSPGTSPIRGAGVMLGMGLGGFLDGIVFHQILQLHGMLSARISNQDLVGAKINMFWDGVFHLVVWLMTVIGVALMWRAGNRARVIWCKATFVGSLLMGWGAFNLIEGLINHHLLEIHHVNEQAGLSGSDYGFLGAGALFIVAGMLLFRSRRKA